MPLRAILRFVFNRVTPDFSWLDELIPPLALPEDRSGQSQPQQFRNKFSRSPILQLQGADNMLSPKDHRFQTLRKAARHAFWSRMATPTVRECRQSALFRINRHFFGGCTPADIDSDIDDILDDLKRTKSVVHETARNACN